MSLKPTCLSVCRQVLGSQCCHNDGTPGRARCGQCGGADAAALRGAGRLHRVRPAAAGCGRRQGGCSG